MKRIYDFFIQKATHRAAPWILGALSFMESSVSPIPPDPLLIPMIIAKPKRAWSLAMICTLTSVVGGVVGYMIGLFLFEEWGTKILELYNLVPAFLKLKTWFAAYGVWIIIAKGLTPIPYKVVTITCGAIGFDVTTFVIASVVSRGLRFFLEAALFWKYGERLNIWLRKYATMLTLGLCGLLILGFLIIIYI